MTTVRLVGFGTLEGESWMVDAVKITPNVITCKFRRHQFPSETYTYDFDRVTGKCLDERITCVRLDTGKQIEMPL
ncbi:MAG: hypothetical protein WC455_14335 [Dehalococcoidia bacterium]|jgi:hypothetical protein